MNRADRDAALRAEIAPTLVALRDSLGDEGIQEVIEALVGDAARVCAGLASGAALGNGKAIRGFAHSMKSTAQMFGASWVAAPLIALEADAHAEPDDALRIRVDEAVERYGILAELLAQIAREPG